MVALSFVVFTCCADKICVLKRCLHFGDGTVEGKFWNFQFGHGRRASSHVLYELIDATVDSLRALAEILSLHALIGQLTFTGTLNN